MGRLQGAPRGNLVRGRLLVNVHELQVDKAKVKALHICRAQPGCGSGWAVHGKARGYGEHSKGEGNGGEGQGLARVRVDCGKIISG